MSAYLLGNLLGRLVASYVITWALLFFFGHFDWRLAFRRSYKWYGLLFLAGIFLLGVAGGLGHGGLT